MTVEFHHLKMVNLIFAIFLCFRPPNEVEVSSWGFISVSLESPYPPFEYLFINWSEFDISNGFLINRQNIAKKRFRRRQINQSRSRDTIRECDRRKIGHRLDGFAVATELVCSPSPKLFAYYTGMIGKIRPVVRIKSLRTPDQFHRVMKLIRLFLFVTLCDMFLYGTPMQ